MPVQLFLLLLVAASFAPQVLGATTTKTPTKWNCTNALTAIWDCINKPNQNKSRTTFNNYNIILNMKGLTTLLTNLKNNGCIKAAAWSDVQAWLQHGKPPTPLANIYNKLTKQQKTTLGKYNNEWWNQTLYDEAMKIWNIIDGKINNLTQANQKAINDWNEDYWDACGPFYESSDSDSSC